MISVLIPVFNADIRELANRLHQQAEKTNINFELLVADDCSTNNSLKINNRTIKALTHCQLIEFSENKGRTATRNFLAQKARFDLLLFLDADVLPKNPDFIQKYIAHIKTCDLVFGGVHYDRQPPASNQILRWKYGRAREEKPLKERQEAPYLSFISMAFLIRKKTFLATNDILENRYGIDPVFSYKLKEKKVRICHIDNPIIHYGLETNTKFLEKTKQGLQTFIDFESRHIVPENYRPLQNAFIRLKKLYLTNLFLGSITIFSVLIKRNLLSKNPSLFLFDLYRLGVYIKLKKADKPQ